MKANRNCYFYVKQSHCISLPYIVFLGSVSGLQIPKFWVDVLNRIKIKHLDKYGKFYIIRLIDMNYALKEPGLILQKFLVCLLINMEFIWKRVNIVL